MIFKILKFTLSVRQSKIYGLEHSMIIYLYISQILLLLLTHCVNRVKFDIIYTCQIGLPAFHKHNCQSWAPACRRYRPTPLCTPRRTPGPARSQTSPVRNAPFACNAKTHVKFATPWSWPEIGVAPRKWVWRQKFFSATPIKILWTSLGLPGTGTERRWNRHSMNNCMNYKTVCENFKKCSVFLVKYMNIKSRFF